MSDTNKPDNHQQGLNDTPMPSRFAELAAIVDPRQAQLDAFDIWAAVRDRAYPLLAS